jgi:hypothetical protein
MAIYSGVITGYGSGDTNSNAAGVTHVRREYIDIGSVHLRSITLDQYLDDFLRSARDSGGETKLSVFRLFGMGRRVLALQLPNGTVRKSDAWWFRLATLFFVIPLFSAILGVMVGCSTSVLAVLAFDAKGLGTPAGFLFSIGYTLYGSVAYVRARAAL